jgi:hypothetical protein
MSAPASFNVARQTGLVHTLVHRGVETVGNAFILWK